MSDRSFNFKPVLRSFVVRTRCRHEYTQRTGGAKAGWTPVAECVTVEQEAQAPSLEAMMHLAAMMADRFVAGQKSINGESYVRVWDASYGHDFWVVLDVEIWEHNSLLAKWSDDFAIAKREAVK